MKIVSAAIITTVSLFALSACATSKPKETKSGSVCNQTAASTLVGKKAPSVANIKKLTGSTTVRMIGPKSLVTADYSASRVTVLTDTPTRIVIYARCG